VTVLKILPFAVMQRARRAGSSVTAELLVETIWTKVKILFEGSFQDLFHTNYLIISALSCVLYLIRYCIFLSIFLANK